MKSRLRRLEKRAPKHEDEEVIYKAYFGNDPEIEKFDDSEFIAVWGQRSKGKRHQNDG